MRIDKIQSNISFKNRQNVKSNQGPAEAKPILNLQTNNAMVNFKRDLARNSRIANNADAVQSNIFKATLYKFYNAVKLIFDIKE